MSELIFDLFFKVYLIGSMVYYVPGQMAYVPQEMFIQYSALIFFALSWFVPKKREISNVYMGLILLYGIFNTLLCAFDNISRYTLINLFLGILTIKVLAERIDFDFKKTGKILLCFICLNIFLMALQIIHKDPIFNSVNADKMPQVDIVGFMSIRFCLGVLAAFSLPFVFSLNPWMCLSLVPLLYFSKASTTILAALASFATLLWFKNKKLLISIGVLAAIPAFYYIFFMDMPSGEFTKRLQIWFVGISILKTHPWFGFGLGKWAAFNFTDIQKNGQPEIWLWAHNDILQFFFEQGIFGVFLVYAYFKDFFKRFDSTGNGPVILASFFSLMIISFFHFPWHVGRLVGFSIYIISLMEAHRSANEEIIRIS